MGAIQRSFRLVGAVLPLVAVLGFGACGEDSSVTEPTVEDGAVLAAMEAGIQDEFRAELIYEGVLKEFGLVRPFSNIINAEQRHSAAIARLFLDRGIPVPESRWSPSEVPAFSSLSEACAAGVVAEIENAEIYEGYMALPLPDDVRFVFESNMAASLDKHLPAFQRCS